jgi:hypothetical protein
MPISPYPDDIHDATYELVELIKVEAAAVYHDHASSRDEYVIERLEQELRAAQKKLKAFTYIDTCVSLDGKRLLHSYMLTEPYIKKKLATKPPQT